MFSPEIRELLHMLRQTLGSQSNGCRTLLTLSLSARGLPRAKLTGEEAKDGYQEMSVLRHNGSDSAVKLLIP